MRIRTYTDEEIKKLLRNPNIIRINNKSQIVYSGNFKLWAVLQKLNHKEKTSREIFEEAQFDMSILDSRLPQRRLSLWIKRYQQFGKEYFISSNKFSYHSIDAYHLNSPIIDNSGTCGFATRSRKNDILEITILLIDTLQKDECDEKNKC